MPEAHPAAPGLLHWGILGTGNIAAQFAEGVAGSERCRVVSVGSRTDRTARAFADRFGLGSTPGNYAHVLADPAVQAVYVSLPNSMHHEWTLRALRAGKHVLCEKPIATSVAQAREMFDAAREEGLVLVEAFMYRSHPQTRAVLEHIHAGTIGTVKLIKASFCFRTRKPEANIRFRRDLGGGALLDVGCYCVDFSRLMIREEPASVHVTAHVHESGVDDLAAGTLTFPSGAVASFTCGMMVHTDNSAFVCGDEGYIHVPVPWKPPVRGATHTVARMMPPKMDGALKAPGPQRTTHSVDAAKPLYALEADDFAAAVQDGAAPAVSRDDSLATMRVLEELRRQAGVS